MTVLVENKPRTQLQLLTDELNKLVGERQTLGRTLAEINRKISKKSEEILIKLREEGKRK